MRIVVFGATGMVGSRVTAEAASRGHQVVAVTRSGKAPEVEGDVTAAAAEIGDARRVAEVSAGADAVVNAVPPARDGSDPVEPFARDYAAFLDGLRAAGARRVLVVGGAGSLEVAPGVRLVDTDGFPPEYKPEAVAHAGVLDTLREVDDLDWTYASPAAAIAPGERTGTFRLGGDTLVADAEGNSSISAEDFAIAVVDELEQGAHVRRRFTAAY